MSRRWFVPTVAIIAVSCFPAAAHAADAVSTLDQSASIAVSGGIDGAEMAIAEPMEASSDSGAVPGNEAGAIDDAGEIAKPAPSDVDRQPESGDDSVVNCMALGCPGSPDSDDGSNGELDPYTKVVSKELIPSEGTDVTADDTGIVDGEFVATGTDKQFWDEEVRLPDCELPIPFPVDVDVAEKVSVDPVPTDEFATDGVDPVPADEFATGGVDPVPTDENTGPETGGVMIGAAPGDEGAVSKDIEPVEGQELDGDVVKMFDEPTVLKGDVVELQAGGGGEHMSTLMQGAKGSNTLPVRTSHVTESVQNSSAPHEDDTAPRAPFVGRGWLAPAPATVAAHVAAEAGPRIYRSLATEADAQNQGAAAVQLVRDASSRVRSGAHSASTQDAMPAGLWAALMTMCAGAFGAGAVQRRHRVRRARTQP